MSQPTVQRTVSNPTLTDRRDDDVDADVELPVVDEQRSIDEFLDEALVGADVFGVGDDGLGAHDPYSSMLIAFGDPKLGRIVSGDATEILGLFWKAKRNWNMGGS